MDICGQRITALAYSTKKVGQYVTFRSFFGRLKALPRWCGGGKPSERLWSSGISQEGCCAVWVWVLELQLSPFHFRSAHWQRERHALPKWRSSALGESISLPSLAVRQFPRCYTRHVQPWAMAGSKAASGLYRIPPSKCPSFSLLSCPAPQSCFSPLPPVFPVFNNWNKILEEDYFLDPFCSTAYRLALS